ncbi:MAG TPA: 50S ribosomal protein L3 N(5)-glutamine methyltransferase [Burkholderiales bacterium]|nr:50S ribosomal protein L3 N(5)-glutamine methyltransferase [Burkholderiales bacterium]
MNVGELLRETADRFRKARLHFGHGTSTARDEASWLIGHVAGIHPGDVHLHLKEPISARYVSRVRLLRERRVRERIPLAYLLREAWLDGRTFYVDRRVIVPRSYISELLRDGLQPWLKRPGHRVLDLCTGSGCLAILAALAFPRAKVDATDISAGALSVARTNVERYELQRRIRLVRSDLFAAIRGERYDLILTNPPYVDARTMRKLPREYRHEPRGALEAGADGLDFVRRILREARDHLTPRGLLVCEVGDSRLALERAFPLLPFTWLDTSEPEACVFLLERDRLPVVSRTSTIRGSGC